MKTPIKIATIEDEFGWQYLIKREVEKENIFKIALATKCGDDFFEQYNHAQQPLDFVLLDINLPCTPGIEVAKRIKKEYPNLPIIVFTSSKHRSDRMDFVSIEVNYYISKARITKLHEDLKIIMGLGNSKYKHRLLPIPYNHYHFFELICAEKTSIEMADILNVNPKNIDYLQKTICDYYHLNNSKLALMDFARSYDIL